MYLLLLDDFGGFLVRLSLYILPLSMIFFFYQKKIYMYVYIWLKEVEIFHPDKYFSKHVPNVVLSSTHIFERRNPIEKKIRVFSNKEIPAQSNFLNGNSSQLRSQLLSSFIVWMSRSRSKLIFSRWASCFRFHWGQIICWVPKFLKVASKITIFWSTLKQ